MANDQTNVELSDLIRTIVRETVAELVSTGTITTTKPPLAETAQLLTAKETAKRLSISERHLYTLTRSGELPCIHIGKAVRYSLVTIQHWIDQSESREMSPSTKTTSKQMEKPNHGEKAKLASGVSTKAKPRTETKAAVVRRKR